MLKVKQLCRISLSLVPKATKDNRALKISMISILFIYCDTCRSGF